MADDDFLVVLVFGPDVEVDGGVFDLATRYQDVKRFVPRASH